MPLNGNELPLYFLLKNQCSVRPNNNHQTIINGILWGKINWVIHFVDGSVVRAHQHAAGARRGELDPNSVLSAIEQVQEREALGWSKGGFSTKIHLRCDGNGRPITFLLSVGERHEAVLFEPLMEQSSIKMQGSLG